MTVQTPFQQSNFTGFKLESWLVEHRKDLSRAIDSLAKSTKAN